MGTRPESAFNINLDRECIFVLVHYEAKPYPNVDQLLVII